jgi:hypothetical protein
MINHATFMLLTASYLKTNIMKRTAYPILASVLLMLITLKVSAQSEETRNVSGFNSIASAGPFNVHVNINGTESLKLEASPDIINEIETVVENGKLEIKFKNHHRWHDDNIGRVDVYITAISLSALYNAGSGAIKVDGELSGDKVNISLSGSGDIASAVKSGSLRVSIAGSGSVHLNGGTGDTNVDIAGSGEMLGKEFKTGSAHVSIAGSGNAYLVADKELSASIIGSGNVIYSGNASVESKTIGSGRVTKE